MPGSNLAEALSRGLRWREEEFSTSLFHLLYLISTPFSSVRYPRRPYKQLSPRSRMPLWLRCFWSKQMSGLGQPGPTAQLFWQLSQRGRGLSSLQTHKSPWTLLKVHEDLWLCYSLQTSFHKPQTGQKSPEKKVWELVHAHTSLWLHTTRVTVGFFRISSTY